MASLVLMAAGQSLMGGVAAGGMFGMSALTGAAIGGMVGATAGAVVDSMFLIPEIMGTDHQSSSGPRIEEPIISLASEGTDIPFMLGNQIRSPGFLFYAGEFIEEVIVNKSSGGKGGSSSSSSITYTYFCDLAVGIGTGGNDQVEEIEKMWGDNKKILEKIRAVNMHSNKLSVTKRGGWMIVDSTLQKMTRLLVGVNATFADWGNSGNNGTFKVWGVKLTGGGNSRARLWNPNCVDESAGRPIWVHQDSDNRGAGRVDSIEIFTGADDQDAWEMIENDKGIDSTPAFRGMAYVGLERLALDDFGERIPNITFQMVEKTGRTRAEAIDKIMERAGYTAGQWDTSRVRGNMRGMNLPGIQDSRSGVLPIAQAFGLRVRVSQGVIIFFQKGDENIVDVSSGDLGAAELGEEPTRFSKTRVDPRSLPSEVTVTYLDARKKQEKGAQQYRHPTLSTEIKQKIEIPIVMSSAEAQRYATTLLWEYHNENETVRFTLPPKYMDVEETDIIIVEAPDGHTYNVRVTEINRGANMLLEMRGTIQPHAVLNIDDCFDEQDPDVAPDDDPPIHVPPPLPLFILDIPAIEPDKVEEPGFYIAVSPADDQTAFKGAMIYQSATAAQSSVDGFPWNERTPMTKYITYGELINEPGPAAPASGEMAEVPGAWEDVLASRPIVEIFRGTLTDRTKDEVLEGFNNALLGNEIIGFQEATLLNSGRYKLKKLIRGLRDTRQHMSTHVKGERFIMLEPDRMVWIKKWKGAIGQVKYFKAVSSGGTVEEFDQAEDYQTDTGLFQANSVKAFAPKIGTTLTQPAYTGNDLNLPWTFVTRQFASATDEGEAALEEVETYEVDVYNAGDVDGVITVNWANGVVDSYKSGDAATPNGSKITVNGDGTSNFYYDAQDQVGTSGPTNPRYFRIYQVHKYQGRGNFAELLI